MTSRNNIPTMFLGVVVVVSSVKEAFHKEKHPV